MNNIAVKGGFTIAGLTLSTIFGGWDSLLYTLLILIVVDYMSGVLAAAKNQTLSSKTGHEGIFKKVMIILLVVLAVCMDRTLALSEPYIRSGVLYFFIANEGISILENARDVGIKIPDILTSVLKEQNERGHK